MLAITAAVDAWPCSATFFQSLSEALVTLLHGLLEVFTVLPGRLLGTGSPLLHRLESLSVPLLSGGLNFRILLDLLP